MFSTYLHSFKKSKSSKAKVTVTVASSKEKTSSNPIKREKGFFSWQQNEKITSACEDQLADLFIRSLPANKFDF